MKRLLAALLCLCLAVPSFSATLTVPPGSTGNQLRDWVQNVAVDGDVVNVPAGTYTLKAPILITNKGISLIGEGPLTVLLVPTTGDSGGKQMNAIEIANNNAVTNMRIQRLKITSSTGFSSNLTNAGIHWASTAGGSFDTWLIDHVTVAGFRDGFSLDNSGSGGTGVGEHLTISDCSAIQCHHWGFNLMDLPQSRMQQCNANVCDTLGIRVLSCGAGFVMEGCVAQLCNASGGTSLEGNAQCLIKLTHGFTVAGYYSENLGTVAGAARVGLTISNCFGGTITSAHISDPAAQIDSYGIRLISGSHGININSFDYTTVAYPISADATSIYPTVLPRNVIKF